jgi:hypothetical protein
MPNANPPTRPPAPSTDAAQHLLVRGVSRPIVTAQLVDLHGVETLFVRLEVDDDMRGGARHTTRFSVSGPRSDVAALIAELAHAAEHPKTPPTT